MSRVENYEDERRPIISRGRSSSQDRDSSAKAEGTAIEFVSQPTCLGKLCDPRTLAHRLFILIFMAFLSFGSYFCYDNPGAMQEVFMQEMSLSNTQYMSLYGWYSWPNVIICFFGGFLIDRVFGIRLGTIVFSSILTLGQVVFAGGAFLNSYWTLVAGRFLFGIGGESLAVAGNNYVVKWFAGRELNMVFGLQLSISRLGSVFNMNSMQMVFNWVSDRLGESTPGYIALGVALLIACGICLYSLFCAFMMAIFDKRADRLLNRGQQSASGTPVNLLDVFKFPVTFWLICIICVFYYVTVFPFISMGLLFFRRKYDLDQDTILFTNLASLSNSMVYILSAIMSPIAGLAVDRIGRNVYWILGATFFTGVAHAIMAYTYTIPIVATFIMGISYSILASSLWPLVSFVVPSNALGSAYGMMQAIQNLGLALMSIVVGKLLDYIGYLITETFFIACLGVALIAGALLFLADAVKGGELNMSGHARRERAAAAALLAAEEKAASRETSVPEN